jgi:tetratricopeptide (TPR) repeat protein
MILNHLQSHHADFGSIKGRIAELLNLPESDGTPRTPGSAETEPSSISLCMIVKNEEVLLPQCLNSVKDFVDETIVVDTGSTDKTVEIAEHHGAKVYHHPWENDFSKHRNQSISYAQGDWILIMDADEILRKGDGPKIREVVANNETDSVLVTVVNYFNQGAAQSWANQVRLFRRKPEIFYDGIVHNQLSGYDSPVSCPVYIHHYGYDLVPKMMKAKFERTSSLLKKRIEQNPEDFRHYHDLCVSYSMNSMFEEAVSTGLKAISLAAKAKGNGGVLVLWTYFIVASSCLKLRNAKDAENYALEALKICPDHLDCNFILSIVYHKLEDQVRFEEFSGNYLGILEALKSSPEQFGYMVNNTATEEWRIHLANADFCLSHGQTEEARQAFDLAMGTAPNQAKCYQAIAGLYRKRRLWDLAEEHYMLAMNEADDSPDSLVGMAVLYRSKGDHIKYKEMVDRLRRLDTDNEDVLTEIGICDLAQGSHESAILAFEKALQKSPNDAEIYTKLALAYRHLGKIDEATDYNLKALSLKDDALEALINLGHVYFEKNRYDDAAHLYARAHKLQPDLIDVSLRLAWIRIVQGDAEGCLGACDSILKTLNISCDMAIYTLDDLAKVFQMIYHFLREKGNLELSNEAFEIALRLNAGCERSALVNH